MVSSLNMYTWAGASRGALGVDGREPLAPNGVAAIVCTIEVLRKEELQPALLGAVERVGEGGRRGGLDEDVGASMMGVPQRAHEIWVCECPGIDGGVNSSRRVAVAIGSIMSWPLCIADSTERRVSQLSDGARSKRIVGSLQFSRCAEVKTQPRADKKI